ncbi:MAG: tRNA (adenosine(37)-N6)-threonylcarbamoyltransferase complex ATPase subunit type 1 TsaE [Elusimicrobiota bacterium]
MLKFNKNKNEQRIVSHSVAETREVAGSFSQIIAKGDTILLIGDLGSGKTTFTKAVAKELGVKDIVRSPSFTLVNEYSGDYSLAHFDFYRLDNDSQVEDLGWEEYINSNRVIIVEWADRAKSLWPEKRWEIYFKYLDENEREIIIKKIN